MLNRICSKEKMRGKVIFFNDLDLADNLASPLEWAVILNSY
jgi:hypothetical protein